MEKQSLTKKEKFGYWFKIIYLIIFGLICAFGSGYVVTMLVTGVFTNHFLLEPIYALFMGAGSVFCFWCVSWLYKEYKYWINKEKESQKPVEEKKQSKVKPE